MPDMAELAIKMCYSRFRRYCAEVHGVEPGTLVRTKIALEQRQNFSPMPDF
jgi:hypothetical protein